MSVSLSLKNWLLKLNVFLDKPLSARKALLIIGLGIIITLTLFALLVIHVFEPWVLDTFY